MNVVVFHTLWKNWNSTYLHQYIFFVFSIEEGLRQQALNRAQRVRKHASDPDGLMRVETGSTASNENTPIKKQKQFSDDSSTENSLLDVPELNLQEPPQQQLTEIELVFKPHPKDGLLDRTEEPRYIKTTANATGKSNILL